MAATLLLSTIAGAITVTASLSNRVVGPGVSSTAIVDTSARALPVMAVQGPGNSLWVYWETADAQWQGPLGVGGQGSTNSTPSIAVGANGLPTVAVQGPGNSLWLYWQAADAQWHGPLGVGGQGSTNAAPVISIGHNGLPTVAVQGPGNGLWLYWQTADAQWHGPLGVGGQGSTNAAPAMVFGANGLPTVAVQGPGNSLWLYWQTADAQWHGPLGVGGPGSANATPAIVIGTNGLPTVAVEGPGNSMWLYWQTADAQWHGPLGVGGQGSTNAAPVIVIGAGGLPIVGVDGPGNSLWLYWQTADAQWHGPLGPGNPSSVTVPSGTPYLTFSATLNENGTGTGYSAYLGVHDAFNDALSVGIQTDPTSTPSQGPYYIWELVQNGQFTFGYLNPAPGGNNPVTLKWWSGSNMAVFYEGSTPVADIPSTFTPRLSFTVEGDARQNGDSVNDSFTNAQIQVGNQCPTYCGLTGSWNTSSDSFYGLHATNTNGAPQNGANFTVTGTASGLPPGGNWGTALVAGMASIPQYWAG